MTQIKSRNWTKQEDEDLLTILSELQEKQQEATWNQIAELMKQRNPGSRKTGKQCRQRWANQLDPRIKRSQNWSKEENQTLFKLHLSLGNKWSEISSHIPGRTDNCVKNHFYSTMRRGMRKINSYIQNVKRKTTLAKTFKNQILNKILTLCEGKNDDKFQFNEAAKQLALSIKTNLVRLSLQLSDIDQQNSNFKQEIFQQISQFSRNCRKRKAKKSCQLSNNYEGTLQDKLLCKTYSNIIKQNKLIQAVDIKQKNIKRKSKNDSHEIQQQEPKAIKVPLYQITGPNQGLNKEQQLKRIKKNEVNLLKSQKQQFFEDKNRINSFSCFFANPQFFNFYPTRTSVNQTSEKRLKCQNQSANQEVHMGFLSTLPDISKNPQSNTLNLSNTDRKNDTGVIDFSNFPVAPQLQVKQSMKQKINGVFPEMIKSQQLSQSLNYSFGFQNKQNPISPINSAMDLSMGIAFSPFSMYGATSGFNFFANWPVQQQKFKSTRFQSQNYEEKQKQSQISIQRAITKNNLKQEDPQQDIKPILQGQN